MRSRSNDPERPTTEPGSSQTAATPGGVPPMANVVDAPGSPLRRLLQLFRRYRWWLVCSVVLALALSAFSWWSQGPVIGIRFDEGHGIKPGDAVKYRGIAVGEVQTVKLISGGAGVQLEVKLTYDARHLAREGTQFWIERPQVSLARVSGLETVVGAKYLEMLPGPEDGESLRQFIGSETPIWLNNPGETELLIDFRQGWGLRVGDPLRYRSIDIGEVMGVSLGDDLQTVQVRVRLTHAGTHVARAGSQFWIERPEVSVAGVRGLDTILGGGYVAVIPGPATGDIQRYFVGLDEAPAARDRSPAGLEIILTSTHRRGLSRGASISYRGLPVGRVISVGLAADAATVEARVYIEPQFKHLVRQESKFWYVSGFHVAAGVSGMDMRLDSLDTLLHGGIAMATPEESGDPVTTGERFTFHDQPDDDWLEWSPAIAVGLLPTVDRLPFPARVRLSWQSRRLGFRRSHQVYGWLLPLESQQWLGLTDVLSHTEEAAELELDGQVFVLADTPVTTRQDVGVLDLASWKTNRIAWPTARIRTPTEPEDCLLVNGDSSTQLPLAAGRLHPTDGGWSIDMSLSFDETDWHGASVVATSDAMLVGILSVEDRTGRVVFIPPEIIERVR